MVSYSATSLFFKVLYFMMFKDGGAAGMYACSFRGTLCIYPQELNKAFEKSVYTFMSNIKNFPCHVKTIYDTKLLSETAAFLLSIKQMMTLHILEASPSSGSRPKH
jgi:hypothetical protein